MASPAAIDPAATVASDLSTTAVKDAPLLSRRLGGEPSSSTLPAPETTASTTSADEKSTNPLPIAELSSSISLESEPVHSPTLSAQATNLENAPALPTGAALHNVSETSHSIAIDEAGPPVPAPPARAKSLSITLLLISGVRYPFTINSEYMSRHNIQVEDQDPMQMGVFALKECIWKEWRDEEWNVKPASANFIRLIHLGRLLDDRQQLKDCRLNSDTPNVVHMTVRPADTGDDDATQRSTGKVNHSGGRESGRRSSPSCRCVIL